MPKPVALQLIGHNGTILNGRDGSRALRQEGPTTEAVVFLDTGYVPGQKKLPNMSNGESVKALVDTGRRS